MQTYYPYNPNQPAQILNESHKITNGTVTLNHLPLADSISISGFTPTSSLKPAQGSFFYNYSAETAYREATGILTFNAADDGTTIKVSYQAVGTVIRASDLNEIKAHLENEEIHGSNYDLPTATATTKGGVKIGDGLSIDEDGVLSCTIQGGSGGGLIDFWTWEDTIEHINSQVDADDKWYKGDEKGRVMRLLNPDDGSLSGWYIWDDWEWVPIGGGSSSSSSLKKNEKILVKKYYYTNGVDANPPFWYDNDTAISENNRWMWFTLVKPSGYGYYYSRIYLSEEVLGKTLYFYGDNEQLLRTVECSSIRVDDSDSEYDGESCETHFSSENTTQGYIRVCWD